MTAPTVDRTDAVLLDLWVQRHDDDTPDRHAAAMTVDTRIAVGVAFYARPSDDDDLTAAL